MLTGSHGQSSGWAQADTILCSIRRRQKPRLPARTKGKYALGPKSKKTLNRHKNVDQLGCQDQSSRSGSGIFKTNGLGCLRAWCILAFLDGREAGPWYHGQCKSQRTKQNKLRNDVCFRVASMEDIASTRNLRTTSETYWCTCQMQCRTPVPFEQIRSQIFQDCISIKSQLHVTADGNPTLRAAALTLSARACGFLYTLALAFETLRRSNLPSPPGNLVLCQRHQWSSETYSSMARLISRWKSRQNPSISTTPRNHLFVVNARVPQICRTAWICWIWFSTCQPLQLFNSRIESPLAAQTRR